jgi:hypothetical protein
MLLTTTLGLGVCLSAAAGLWTLAGNATVTSTSLPRPPSATVTGGSTALPAKPSTTGTWFVGEVGTYLVGRGIPPGTYESVGGQDGRRCEWARLKGLATTAGDVLAAGSTSSRASVTILATDAFFQTKDCANWRKVS